MNYDSFYNELEKLSANPAGEVAEGFWKMLRRKAGEAGETALEAGKSLSTKMESKPVTTAALVGTPALLGAGALAGRKKKRQEEE